MVSDRMMRCEIWHLFDTRYGIPITKLDVKNLNRTNLTEYSHIILPSYSWKQYKY